MPPEPSNSRCHSIVKQYWAASGLARFREEGVLKHTMLTRALLTRTVLTAYVLWPTLSHGACGGPAAPLAATGA